VLQINNCNGANPKTDTLMLVAPPGACYPGLIDIASEESYTGCMTYIVAQDSPSSIGRTCPDAGNRNRVFIQAVAGYTYHIALGNYDVNGGGLETLTIIENPPRRRTTKRCTNPPKLPNGQKPPRTPKHP